MNNACLAAALLLAAGAAQAQHRKTASLYLFSADIATALPRNSG